MLTQNSDVNLYAVWTAAFTVTYNANGGTDAPEPQTKFPGVTLRLSNDEPVRTGYDFLGWSANQSAQTAQYYAGDNFSVDADTTLYALWLPKAYVVRFLPNGGTGAPGQQTKNHDEPLILSYKVPTRAGYLFLGWARSSSAVEAEYYPGSEYTEEKDALFYALWAAAYSVTVENGTGSGSFISGGKVNITADAPPLYQMFDKWSSNDGVTFDNASSSSTSFTMPNKPVTVTASYKPMPPKQLTVVGGTGGGMFSPGSIVTVTANTPESGKRFKEWTSSAGIVFTDRKSSTTTFVMPASESVTVTAVFEIIPPTASSVTVVGGTGGGSYAPGVVVTITANTVSGKLFKEWVTSDGVVFFNKVSPATSFTMPAKDVTVTATYHETITEYAISISPLTNGKITSNLTTAAKDTVIILTVTPDLGYRLKSGTLKVNGVEIEGTSFKMPENNATVTAEFEIIETAGFSVTKDAYAFDNSRASFGYPVGYKIPLERYKEVFGPVDGTAKYNRSGTWGGSCFGFSSTAGLFYTGNLTETRYGAETVFGIPTPGIQTSNTTKLLERFQISQLLLEVQRQFKFDIPALIDAVSNFQKTGQSPVMVLMWGKSGGHAVLGYAVTKTSSGYEISLYDNCFPASRRVLYIGSDMKTWRNEDWSAYGFSSAAGGELGFVYTSVVGENMLDYIDNNNLVNLHINSDQVEIYNSDGVEVTKLEEMGVAERIRVFDLTAHNSLDYYLPADTYTIKSKEDKNLRLMSDDMEPYTVDMSDGNTYFSVSSDASFDAVITLGTEPTLDVQNGIGSFDLNVTTLNEGLDSNNVSVYKHSDESFTVSLLGQINDYMFNSTGDVESINFKTSDVEVNQQEGTKKLSISISSDAPADDSDVQITDFNSTRTSTGSDVSAKLTNSTGASITAQAIISVYDNEQLVKLEVIQVTIDAGETIDFNEAVTFSLAPEKSYLVKLYVWKDTSSMIPLSRAFSEYI